MLPVNNEVIETLSEYISNHRQTPEEYITNTFRNRDILFFGGISDSSFSREYIEFVQNMIPHLHSNGITNLGMEYALYDDQEMIDRLINEGADFDEDAARNILFNRHVMWGYREYVDLFRAVWEFNRKLPVNRKPFRIIGLNIRHDWQHLGKKGDEENKEILKKIFSRGLPSSFMAETIQRELIDKGEKALVIGSSRHMVTRYRNIKYGESVRENELGETRGAGNIVYDSTGYKSATILLHYFWYDEKSQFQMDRPVEGVFDALIMNMGDGAVRVGFDTTGTPFGNLPIKTGEYTYGYNNLKFEDLCDGYIILGPLNMYTAVTPIPDFINSGNIETALINIPAPKDSLSDSKDISETIAILNEQIEIATQYVTKSFSLFE